MKTKIYDFALSKGANLVGFSGIQNFSDAPEGFRPTDIMPKAKGIIVLAKAMPKGIVTSGNAVVYTRHHKHVMEQLDTLAYEVSLFIEQHGGIAMPIPADDPYFHWEGERQHGMGILSHRHAAVKAGLGSLGKNALLITPEYGNRVELVTVLTDMAFESPQEITTLCLNSCRLCIDACPSGSQTGSYFIEQKPCRNYTFIKSDRGHLLYRCWQCRAVCPIGK
jgi:epoxyqueuosine reductase QueG